MMTQIGTTEINVDSMIVELIQDGNSKIKTN